MQKIGVETTKTANFGTAENYWLQKKRAKYYYKCWCQTVELLMLNDWTGDANVECWRRMLPNMKACGEQRHKIERRQKGQKWIAELREINCRIAEKQIKPNRNFCPNQN